MIDLSWFPEPLKWRWYILIGLVSGITGRLLEWEQFQSSILAIGICLVVLGVRVYREGKRYGKW